jgi:hypothetical protein
MKNLLEWLAATGLVIGVLMLGAMGDAPIETDAEIEEIAKQEQLSQKAEFNRLALEAQYKTGFVARME